MILAKRDGTSITPVRLDNGAVFVRTVNPLPDGTVQFFLPSVWTAPGKRGKSAGLKIQCLQSDTGPPASNSEEALIN